MTQHRQKHENATPKCRGHFWHHFDDFLIIFSTIFSSIFHGFERAVSKTPSNIAYWRNSKITKNYRPLKPSIFDNPKMIFLTVKTIFRLLAKNRLYCQKNHFFGLRFLTLVWKWQKWMQKTVFWTHFWTLFPRPFWTNRKKWQVQISQNWTKNRIGSKTQPLRFSPNRDEFLTPKHLTKRGRFFEQKSSFFRVFGPIFSRFLNFWYFLIVMSFLLANYWDIKMCTFVFFNVTKNIENQKIAKMTKNRHFWWFFVIFFAFLRFLKNRVKNTR